MLAWYIGSGHGNGNPYGVTAATVSITTISLCKIKRLVCVTLTKNEIVFFSLYNLARSYCPMLVHPNRRTDG